jgi:hypothetical protein
MQQCRRHWHTWLHVLPSIPIAIVLASPINRSGLGALIKHHRRRMWERSRRNRSPTDKRPPFLNAAEGAISPEGLWAR